MPERKREQRTRREFLWFLVVSDLCNQHAKLLKSKSTIRTQVVYAYFHTHIHVHVPTHTRRHTNKVQHLFGSDLWPWVDGTHPDKC